MPVCVNPAPRGWASESFPSILPPPFIFISPFALATFTLCSHTSNSEKRPERCALSHPTCLFLGFYDSSGGCSMHCAPEWSCECTKPRGMHEFIMPLPKLNSGSGVQLLFHLGCQRPLNGPSPNIYSHEWLHDNVLDSDPPFPTSSLLCLASGFWILSVQLF